MIMHRTDQVAAIRALKSATPYIRLFKGKIFVIKAGGAVFGDLEATRTLIEQIAILHYFGVKVVFVHGGGPQLTEITEQLGVPTRMVEGRRVTDQRSIDVTSMVLIALTAAPIFGGFAHLVAGVDFWPAYLTALLFSYIGLYRYEWSHFLIHTPYIPKTRLFRSIWRSHRLHHFKHEDYWMGVTSNFSDRVLGTFPDQKTIEKSPTARTLGVASNKQA